MPSAVQRLRKKIQDEKEKAERLQNEWYLLRPLLGYSNWAIFYLLLGGREAGKSYSVTDFFVHQFVHKGIPFNWMRLTDAQARKLLANNAQKLVDPDIRRRYGLDLVTKGNQVYNVKREKREVHHRDGTTETVYEIVEEKLFARVFSLSTFYTDKGSIFDKDFLKDPNMWYNIAIDEFQREKGEKNTFDILYALVNQLENVVRSTKERMRVFFIGNYLEDASDILCAFNFIPEKFGRYKLKSKRAVIDYIEPSEQYKRRRSGTVADILMPTASTFTNKIDQDKSLITTARIKKPEKVIKFTKDKKDWYTVWDGNVIRQYNNERLNTIIAMRPYLDERFDEGLRNKYIEVFDTRSFMFTNLITFKRFQKNMEMIAPRQH
jgi:hypothetical protein